MLTHSRIRLVPLVQTLREKVMASTSLVVPRSLRTMDGPHRTVHRQHHQSFHPLRSHLGSPVQTQRRHRVLGPFGPHVPGPPNEPVTLKPAILEVIHPIQYGSAPQRPLLPRSDIGILILFIDDISSIRDDFTVWVTVDPTTFRTCRRTKVLRHPCFEKPSKKRVFLPHLNAGSRAGPTGYWSKRGLAF